MCYGEDKRNGQPEWASHTSIVTLFAINPNIVRSLARKYQYYGSYRLSHLYRGFPFFSPTRDAVARERRGWHAISGRQEQHSRQAPVGATLRYRLWTLRS